MNHRGCVLHPHPSPSEPEQFPRLEAQCPVHSPKPREGEEKARKVTQPARREWEAGIKGPVTSRVPRARASQTLGKGPCSCTVTAQGPELTCRHAAQRRETARSAHGRRHAGAGAARSLPLGPPYPPPVATGCDRASSVISARRWAETPRATGHLTRGVGKLSTWTTEEKLSQAQPRTASQGASR